MPSRIAFLSRLLGVFLLVLALAEAVQPAGINDAGNQILSSSSLLFITGMMTVLAGLAIVLVHTVWRGGLAPILVTILAPILGSLMLLKGVALTTLTRSPGQG